MTYLVFRIKAIKIVVLIQAATENNNYFYLYIIINLDRFHQRYISAKG